MNEESIFMEALQRQMPEGARCFPGSRLCNGSRRLLMRRALNDSARCLGSDVSRTKPGAPSGRDEMDVLQQQFPQPPALSLRRQS